MYERKNTVTIFCFGAMIIMVYNGKTIAVPKLKRVVAISELARTGKYVVTK